MQSALDALHLGIVLAGVIQDALQGVGVATLSGGEFAHTLAEAGHAIGHALRRLMVQVELLLHHAEGVGLAAHAVGDAPQDVLDALVAGALLHQRRSDRFAQSGLLSRDLRQGLQTLRQLLEQRKHVAALLTVQSQMLRDGHQRISHGRRVRRAARR